MTWELAPLRLRRRDAVTPALAYRIFRPSSSASPARAAVLVCHGYFENMKRYRHVIERWNELGILVAIYDLRGHGESQGARGFISRFEEYVDDELDMLTELEKDDEWSALRPPSSLATAPVVWSRFSPRSRRPTASAGSRSRRLIWAWRKRCPR